MKEWWDNRTSSQKLLMVVAVLVVIAMNIGDDDGESSGNTEPIAQPEADASLTNGSPSTQSGYGEDDIEYQLAVVDQGGYVDPDDSRIDRYDRVLDSLEEKCGDGRTMLGDMAVRSVQLLDEEGISSTALEMLEGANTAIPADLGRQDSCADIFATLMVLMDG